MSVFEVHGGGDRRSLVKRFMGKTKQQAVSELVDIHLTHCTRAERLEAEIEALRKDAERYRWLISPEVYNGTLGIAGGWIDFGDKDEAQQQIDAAMAGEVSHGE